MKSLDDLAIFYEAARIHAATTAKEKRGSLRQLKAGPDKRKQCDRVKGDVQLTST